MVFRTLLGNFYHSMSCGLKKAVTTYQRWWWLYSITWLMILSKILLMTSYKIPHKEDHHKDLKMVFNQHCSLKMLKFTFGISSRKFLGFLVQRYGIHIREKAYAIHEKRLPKNLRQWKSFLNTWDSWKYHSLFSDWWEIMANLNGGSITRIL